MRADIVDHAIEPALLIQEVEADEQGATVLFLGTVRDHNEGRAVRGIEYSAYRSMAERELRGVAAESVDRFPGVGIVIEHRLGSLDVGEVSVAVATSHAHRAAAYDANRYAVEELKRRAPIWKRELYVDGTREWVDPTGANAGREGDDATAPPAVARAVHAGRP